MGTYLSLIVYIPKELVACYVTREVSGFVGMAAFQCWPLSTSHVAISPLQNFYGRQVCLSKESSQFMDDKSVCPRQALSSWMTSLSVQGKLSVHGRQVCLSKASSQSMTIFKFLMSVQKDFLVMS